MPRTRHNHETYALTHDEYQRLYLAFYEICYNSWKRADVTELEIREIKAVQDSK